MDSKHDILIKKENLTPNMIHPFVLLKMDKG